MPIKFVIINVPSIKWTTILYKHPKVKTIHHTNLSHYKQPFYHLLPICINDCITYNEHPLNVFKNNNLDNLHMLNNKSLFAKYMHTWHTDHIPTLIAYQLQEEFFVNQPAIEQYEVGQKLIYKPNQGCGGVDTVILNEIPINLIMATTHLSNLLSNHNSAFGVISKYVPHTDDWVGHFLIIQGQVIDKIYFNSTIKKPFRQGAIEDYTVHENLPGEESKDNWLYRLFVKLNYSGFACIDFILYEGQITLFEINPRPGGSLISNPLYFDRFLSSLENFINRS